MINDSTSTKSPFQAVIAAHEALTRDVEQSQAMKEIERKSKVSPEQHNKTLNFLLDQFGEKTQKQHQAAQQESGNAAKEAADQTGLQGQSGKGDKATGQQTASGQLGNTATDGNPSGQPGQFAQGSAVSPDQTQVQLLNNAGVVAGEAASTEELKREVKKTQAQGQNQAAGTPNQGATNAENTEQPQTSAGQTGSGSVSGSASGSTDVGAEGEVDKPMTGKLPGWGPPSPPSPQFPPGFSLESLSQKTVQNHVAALTELMTKLSTLMSEDALNKVEANRAHTQKSNEVHQASIRESEAEQLENQKSAEAARTAGTCVMIAVSVGAFFLTALSFLTGGSLTAFAVAAIGLMVMAIDQILAATGNQTITDAVLGPVMEHVLPALLEFFGDIYEAFFLMLGFPEDIAGTLGQVFGAIATVVTIIAATFVAKSLIGKVLGKLMGMLGKLASKIAAKVAPDLTKKLGGKMSAMTGKIDEFSKNIQGKFKDATSRIGKNNPQKAYDDEFAISGDKLKAMEAKTTASEANAKKVASVVGQAQTVATASGIGTMAGTMVSGSTYTYLANLEHALITFLQQALSVNSELMEAIQEHLSGVMEMSQEMMEGALNVQAARNETVSAMLNTMRTGV